MTTAVIPSKNFEKRVSEEIESCFRRGNSTQMESGDSSLAKVEKIGLVHQKLSRLWKQKLKCSNNMVTARDKKKQAKSAGRTYDNSSISAPLPDCVLLIATGTTPAVLTETVWALAHEAIPVIPSRIVVITTLTGHEILKRELLTPDPDGPSSIWEQLRAAIFRKEPQARAKLVLNTSPKIITGIDAKRGMTYPLDDIRTPAEHEAAADFLLAEVQNLTKENDPPLVVSMAGGRKTMGALLYGSMTLQGREQDRLTHVLIPGPYESPLLRPKFYFPEQHPGFHVLPGAEGKKLESRKAKVDLADVPFPRLRNLFGKEYDRLPKTFTEIVKAASKTVKMISNVRFAFEEKSWTIIISGRHVALNGREIPFFHFLCKRLEEGHSPFEFHGAAEDEFRTFLGNWCATHTEEAARYRLSDWGKNVTTEDFRKVLNSLRSRFRNVGLALEAERLFPQRGRLGFFPDSVTILKGA